MEEPDKVCFDLPRAAFGYRVCMTRSSSRVSAGPARARARDRTGEGKTTRTLTLAAAPARSSAAHSKTTKWRA
jgi:hypothetical protein